MYDQKGRKGIIYQKMIYGKRTKSIKEREVLIPNKRPRMNGAIVETEDGFEHSQHNESDNDNLQGEAFTEMANALIKFLEKCQVPQDVPNIKKKFEETVELRKQMMLDLDEYKRLFELYLICPQLVR